ERLLTDRRFLRRSLFKYCKSRVSFEHPVRAQPFAQKHPLKGIMADQNSDQRENHGLRIGAPQFAPLDPWLKIAGKHLNQLAKMPADERIEVLIQLKSAVLQEPEYLRLVHQCLREQLKRTLKDRSPIGGFRDP